MELSLPYKASGRERLQEHRQHLRQVWFPASYTKWVDVTKSTCWSNLNYKKFIWNKRRLYRDRDLVISEERRPRNCVPEICKDYMYICFYYVERHI